MTHHVECPSPRCAWTHEIAPSDGAARVVLRSQGAPVCPRCHVFRLVEWWDFGPSSTPRWVPRHTRGGHRA